MIFTKNQDTKKQENKKTGRPIKQFYRENHWYE